MYTYILILYIYAYIYTRWTIKKRNQNSKKKINKTTNAIGTTFYILIPWVIFYQS